jgi:polyisoprenyl-teichoic acid--peptidoglycan teichoic acid transferase
MAPLEDGGSTVTAASTPLPREVVQAERPDGRSALAAFLSFLFPGLGQAYNRERTLAAVLAAPVVLLVVLIGSAVVAAQSSLLSRLLDIRFLAGLMVLDVALLGWRVVAVVQAHARRQRLSRRHWTTWLTALLVAITFLMHAVPAYYAVLGIDTLNAVALGGTSNGGLTGGFGQVPGFSPLPVPSDQPQVERGERVNILLVGIDSAPSRTTQLTDTMLVVSLDPVGGTSAMVSVPRDLYGVPLPDGRPYNNKLNSLMAVAESHPADYPLGGVGTLKATIGNLLGVRIHYFAAINLLGFKQAVDSIGGVDITVERTINDQTYFDVERNQTVGFYLAAGPHHLDGWTALAFVRSRKGIGDNDFTRADRQQQLLAAMRAKLTAQNLLLVLPGLLDAVKSAIATDVPSDRMPDLAQAVQDADMSNLRRIVLQPPDYMTADPHSSAGYILIPNLPAIRAIGEDLLANKGPTPGSPIP